MTKTVWKIGDACWTALRGEGGLWPARVIHVLSLPDYVTAPMFVLQLDRRDWATLEVRDATLLTADPKVLPPVTLL